MAGIVIEYAHFVEVQQRRARVVQALTTPRSTPLVIDAAVAVGDDRIDPTPSRRQYRSIATTTIADTPSTE